MTKQFIDDRPPKQKQLGHWRFLEGQQAYAEGMKRLSPPRRTLDLPTDYMALCAFMNGSQNQRDVPSRSSCYPDTPPEYRCGRAT